MFWQRKHISSGSLSWSRRVVIWPIGFAKHTSFNRMNTYVPIVASGQINHTSNVRIVVLKCKKQNMIRRGWMKWRGWTRFWTTDGWIKQILKSDRGWKSPVLPSFDGLDRQSHFNQKKCLDFQVNFAIITIVNGAFTIDYWGGDVHAE